MGGALGLGWFGDAMRRIAGALAATVFGLLVAVGGAEIAARVIMPHWSEFASERFVASAGQPGYGVFAIGRLGFDGFFAQNNGDFRVAIHIDPRGLRNPDDAKPEGALWAVGDSFTFGWGVERSEIFGAVAAGQLGLPFFSVASPGTDVCGYMGLIARQTAPRTPKAVVVGITMENDLEEYAGCGPSDTSSPPPLGGLPSKKAVKEWLLAHSAFYNLLASTLKRSVTMVGWLQRLGIVEPEANQSWHQARHSNAVIDGTAAAVARLRAMLPADVPFAVVLIPARFDLMEADGEWAGDRHALATALAGRGLKVVDPSAGLRNVGIDRAHFPHDGHWSALGHRIAGEALATVIGPMLTQDSSR